MSLKNYSPRNSLSVIDLQKIWTGVGVVLTGSLGAVAIDLLAQAVLHADMGTYGGIVTAGVLSIVVNAWRKYRADNIPQ